MKHTLVIGFLLILFLIGSYFVNQRTEARRLNLANKTIESLDRSLNKLGVILVGIDVLRYDVFLGLADVHETEYWIDIDDEFKYVYFDYLILKFDASEKLVDIRTNTL